MEVKLHRAFGVLIMLFGLFLALPPFRRFLLTGMLPCFCYAILLVLVKINGHQQAPYNKARKFFDGFRVGGHRGSPLVAPENTLESLKEALHSSMDLVEFDLALSKDGIAVLMHDDDLMRTCGVPGLVASYFLEELGNHDAGHSFYKNKENKRVCRIPTLVETVDFCRQNKLKMLFDVKDGSLKMVTQIASVIRENDLYDEIIVSSFYPWVSYAVKKADPKILTGITWRPRFFSYADLESSVPRFGGMMHYAASFLDWLNVNLLYSWLPKFLGVEMMLAYEKEICGSLVDKMDKQGIQVVAWTVNNIPQMLYFLDVLNVPLLTDDPRLSEDLERARNGSVPDKEIVLSN